MSKKKTARKSGQRELSHPIFDSLRKPVAPPGHALSQAKPDAVARPAGRKAKHKRRAEPMSDDE